MFQGAIAGRPKPCVCARFLGKSILLTASKIDKKSTAEAQRTQRVQKKTYKSLRSPRPQRFRGEKADACLFMRHRVRYGA
jgi:hypothetical protein